MPRRRSRSELQVGRGLPSSLSLVLSNEILIEKESLPAFLHNRLIRLAAFQNPEFQPAQAMRRSSLRAAADRGLRRGLSPPHRPAWRMP